ncbi:hypothetical protein [Saccharopolyspora sp. NPDC002376]
MIRRSARRKAISPAGFLLVMLCFGLPFVTVSCESSVGSISAEITGWDLVFGGKATTTATGDFAPTGPVPTPRNRFRCNR